MKTVTDTAVPTRHDRRKPLYPIEETGDDRDGLSRHRMRRSTGDGRWIGFLG